MAKVQVLRSKLNGSVRCPSSKSYTHRAIAIASLSAGQSEILNPLLARDTRATLDCCRAFGAKFQERRGKLIVPGKNNELLPPENVLNAENSGTTIRIMTAMAGLVRTGHVVLTGDDSLRKRPMQPILDALGSLGVEAFSTKADGRPPLVVRGGGIKGGTAVIDGSISSQFISGILIAGIYANSEITLRIKDNNLVSKPYVEATLATMNQFGAKIDHDPDMLEYHIGKAEYTPTRFKVPSDFSTCALILCAGALVGEKLKVKGLDFELPQGDSKIIEIMRQMGCAIKTHKTQGEVTIEGVEALEGGQFNLGDTPDLLPVVSMLALKARSTVKIIGVEHARVKETDRVASIARELVKLGATVNEFKDGLSITKPKRLKNAILESYNDHRLFMAFTIASMLTEHSIVEGAESVDVSYPNFIEDMLALGAKIKIA